MRHHSYLLLKLIQCWLLKRYSLTLISLLFGELNILGLLHLLLHILTLSIGHGSIHWLSLTWHWRALYEFIMYSLNTLSKRRVLVPVFYDWTLVGDCSLIYIGVGDIGHHVNLRLHRWELISECDFYKKWPWRNGQHKWHSILLGLSSRVFHEKDSLWIDLFQLAYLDIFHGLVVLVALSSCLTTGFAHRCVIKIHL